jgi:hypothetical protein
MHTTPPGDAAPREPMTKDVVSKDDGRTLIYYRFGARPEQQSRPASEPDEEGVQA